MKYTYTKMDEIFGYFIVIFYGIIFMLLFIGLILSIFKGVK